MAEEWLAGINQHLLLFSRSKCMAEEWLAGINQLLLLFSRSKYMAEIGLTGLNTLYSSAEVIISAKEWLAGKHSLTSQNRNSSWSKKKILQVQAYESETGIRVQQNFHSLKSKYKRTKPGYKKKR